MNVEEILKDLIISKYNSINSFSAAIGISNSTVDSIFKRGIANANITNIIKICDELHICADELAKGNIVYRHNINREITTTSEAQRIAVLYDKASVDDKKVVHAVLDKYDIKRGPINADNDEKGVAG